jgi:hypothetical protein
MYDFLNKEIYFIRKFKLMSLILMFTNIAIIIIYSIFVLSCFIDGGPFIGTITYIIVVSMNCGMCSYNFAYNKILFGERV